MASTCGHSQEMGTIIFTSKKQHQGGLLSKKDTSLGLFPYFLILLSFFGLKLVLNILLWLQNYEI